MGMIGGRKAIGLMFEKYEMNISDNNKDGDDDEKYR